MEISKKKILNKPIVTFKMWKNVGIQTCCRRENAFEMPPRHLLTPKRPKLLCQDYPGWVIPPGLGCSDFVTLEYCLPDGQPGPGWNPVWGSLTSTHGSLDSNTQRIVPARHTMASIASKHAVGSMGTVPWLRPKNLAIIWSDCGRQPSFFLS